MAENFERPDKVEIKQFTTNCLNMSGGTSPVTLYLGHPMRGSHPLAFQNKSLSTRGYSIPEHVMESFKKLADIAEKNNVPFVELCDYVIKEVELGKSLQDDSKRASEISENTDDKDLQSTQLIEASTGESSANDPLSNKNQADLNDQEKPKEDSLPNQEQSAQVSSGEQDVNPISSDAQLEIDNSLKNNDVESKSADQNQSLFNKVSKKDNN
ncbi:MAG: hypothetical protein RL769_472 [Pseudomonadota bacterium]|jgi:hypothetical protein